MPQIVSNFLGHVQSESQSQSTSKETKKGQENEGDSEDSGGKKKQSHKRGASIS